MKKSRPYNREVAIDAALNLFWKKGYHATSLKDLEAALNMKPGSIYAAFTNKETLYRETLKRYFEQSQKALKAEFETAKSPMDGLANYLRQLGACRPNDPHGRACMLIKTILDTSATDERISADASTYLDEILKDIIAAFEHAKALSEIPRDADTTRLGQRFQSNVTALRIELHRGINEATQAALAEDMIGELAQLRIPQEVSTSPTTD